MPPLLWNVWMYLQFHSVKEPSKNRDMWVRVLFGSLWSLGVWFCSGSCMFWPSCSVRFSSWQNLGSGLVRSCWVRILSPSLLVTPLVAWCGLHHSSVCLLSYLLTDSVSSAIVYNKLSVLYASSNRSTCDLQIWHKKSSWERTIFDTLNFQNNLWRG